MATNAEIIKTLKAKMREYADQQKSMADTIAALGGDAAAVSTEGVKVKKTRKPRSQASIAQQKATLEANKAAKAAKATV